MPASPETHAGYAVQAGAPVILDDLREEKRFRGSILLHDHGVRSGIAVPVSGGGVGRGAIYGVLTVHTHEQRTFDPEDIEFLESIATILASAIARERSVRLQRQLDQSQHLRVLEKPFSSEGLLRRVRESLDGP